METSATATAAAMAPLLLRNLITTIFISADKSLYTLSTKFKVLQFIRHLLTSFFLYFLRILPALFPSSLNPPRHTHQRATPKADALFNKSTSAIDSGIGRALSQLLSIVNDIPVSSRKYEVVRSLAEKIVDDNNREGFESLREVNRTVLSAAFERTLRRLENAALAEERGDLGFGFGPLQTEFYYLSKCLKALRYVGDAAWARMAKPRSSEVAAESAGGGSAEKLAAEALWLAQKLAACGYVQEAVWQWASASSLAWLSLMAEPRLQSSLVKLSAFLLKQAKEMSKDSEALEEDRKLRHRQMKMKMLISWLPLLCRGSNGTHAPVLSTWERAELERILEEMIDELDCLEDQEKVLSLWLHHFTYSSLSDWPNLRNCYARWCAASRKRLLLQ
uniref:1,8-cineole synthase n=1 Tax=Kalanchoe fedtschenkoi TaxID=63787 RepID=A0A7N0T174_KALFE